MSQSALEHLEKYKQSRKLKNTAPPARRTDNSHAQLNQQIEQEELNFWQAIDNIRRSTSKKNFSTVSDGVLAQSTIDELLEKAKNTFPKASPSRRKELLMVLTWADNVLKEKDSADVIKECVIQEIKNESPMDNKAYRIMKGIGWIVLGIVLGIGVISLGYYFVFPIAESSLRSGFDPGLCLFCSLCVLPILSIKAGIDCFLYEPSIGKEARQFGAFFKEPTDLQGSNVCEISSSLG